MLRGMEDREKDPAAVALGKRRAEKAKGAILGPLPAGQGVMLPDMAKQRRKDPAAVALGRKRAKKAGPDGMSAIGSLGASAGGTARAANLTPEQRKAIAKKASDARWKKNDT
jgi:hypothetical protein